MFEFEDDEPQEVFTDDKSVLVYAIFETRRDQLWNWMKGKEFALTSLMHIDKTFPDCIKLLNFGTDDLILGREELKTSMPGTPDYSVDTFPVLEVIPADELQAIWSATASGDNINELLFGDKAFLFEATPKVALFSEENARLYATMRAAADPRFERDGENVILRQIIHRRATERLFGLMQAYDLYSRNKDHLLRIFRTRRTFDSFGNEELHEVMDEIDKFCGKKARFNFSDQALFDTMIFIQKDIDGGESESKEDWADFERECADILRENGFAVMDTRRTGDFGADIVAEKSELTYVIQCKWHGKPIGVSAVQEVVAARAHYVADYCAVVSRTKFTDAAVQLARSNEVALLDVDGLARLESVFG